MIRHAYAVLSLRWNRVVEWTLRLFAVATYTYTIAALAIGWSHNAHPLNLLVLMIVEGFTLTLIIVARPATDRDASPLLVLATTYSSGFFLLLDGDATRSLLPEALATAVQVVGLALTLSAKLSLGRSFGILPGVRGLVTTGPYGFVRHPMYLGYLIVNAGFLLSNGSLRNVEIMSALLLVQLLRILREEALMKRSGSANGYDAYCARVRHRLLPGIF